MLSNGMPKAPAAADAELTAEIERQHAITRESLAQILASRGRG